jgi:pyridoxal phosphate enzyme (YggS family)
VFAQGLKEVLQKIEDASKQAHRNDVASLMAVSKFQPIEKMLELYHQGQRVFGENYVQELIEKKQRFEQLQLHDVDLQFIGHLQTNKVKALLPSISTIHSVDSIKLLDELEKRARELNKKIQIYLQVNIDREESKGGFAESDLPDLNRKVESLDFLIPAGLMCIPDPNRDPLQAFLKLKHALSLYPNLGNRLSMGMSDDYVLAISAGSTMVRIGSALFGPRINATPK